jgi:hypothetical protein
VVGKGWLYVVRWWRAVGACFGDSDLASGAGDPSISHLGVRVAVTDSVGALVGRLALPGHEEPRESGPWTTSRPNLSDPGLRALTIDQASETPQIPGQNLGITLRLTGNGREPALQAAVGTMNAPTRLDNPAEELRFVALAGGRASTTPMNVLLLQSQSARQATRRLSRLADRSQPRAST